MNFKGMSFAGLFRRSLNGFNKHLFRIVSPLFIRPDAFRFTPIHLGEGEGDGAWPVCLELLAPGSVCYCVGVGVNASFDVELAKRGCEVHSFDPTPKAKDYAVEVDLASKGVNFHPIGVWHEAKTLKLFAPSNPLYVNYSVVDLHGTDNFVEVVCEPLAGILRNLSHQALALLKLDVEGSWEMILDHMISENIRPVQLCVEFDSPTSLLKVVSMVRKLSKAGYAVVWFNGENFLFVLKSSL